MSIVPLRIRRAGLPILAAACVLTIAGVAAQGGGRRFAALTNPIVNAPDTTEHDTQNTVAIVRVVGSQVNIAAYNDSSVYTGSNNHKVGWARSTDNGTTWTPRGTLPDSANGDGGNPVLARDTTSGKIYLATTAFSGSAIQIFRSTDNGGTWLAPVNAAPGFGGGDVLVNPWIVVDNFVGTGQGNVYVIAKNIAGGGGGSLPSGTYVSRSTDGGATFGLTPGILSTIWLNPSIAVDGNHAVYAFGTAIFAGFPNVIKTRKSTDAGATFGGFVDVATLNGGDTNGDLHLGGGFTTYQNAYPFVDPIGTFIGVVYNDKNGTDKSDIFITGSGDGGATWDEPEILSFDPNKRDQFMPSMVFTPDGRHFLLSWYDRRSDPANSLIERWGIIATRGPGGGECCSISPNFRISTGSWPVVVGQDSYVPATYMGGYDQMTAGTAFFGAAWSDNRLPNPANGPLPHVNQPDVRFALLPVNGPARGDLDRDLQTDRTIFRPSNGGWYSALSNGGATSTVWGVSTDIDVQGDYDGDAKSDVAVFRPSTGQWYIVLSSTGGIRVVQWGANGDVPLAGDVNGDSVDDLAIFRPSLGAWYVLESSGEIDVYSWGTPGDIPMLGDFVDGNGADDITVYRPSLGAWYSLSAWTGGSIIVGWGTSSDIPVVGDFDGDGFADPTVFRPSTGQWWVKKSTGGTMLTQWGINGDTPVSGDFDGDGLADTTIWRDSNGGWYSLLSSGGSSSIAWGVSGDKPSGRVPGS